MRVHLRPRGGTGLKPGIEIGGATRIYPVIGDPIAQVQTPRLINPLFAEHGLDIVSVPVHTPADRLRDIWEALRVTPNVAGIAVTVPHKVSAAGLCSSLTDAAQAVGAVNTVRRAEDGAMHGALFDGVGFVEGLGDERKRLEDGTVLLIGAGGAGRAIAHALAAEKIARLHIVDERSDAAAMAASMVNQGRGCAIATTAWPDFASCDVVINATPLGLKPEDPLPLSEDSIRAAMLIADIAALDRETPLLAAARRLGCATSDGDAMLKAQLGLVAGFIAGLPAGSLLTQDPAEIR